MLLSVTMLGEPPDLPATDLGFLLHKHPDRVQTFASRLGHGARLLPRGDRPSAAPPRCCSRSTRSALVRGAARAGARRRSRSRQYVNDRPYAASSLLAVALGTVFAHARCAGAATPGPSCAATRAPAARSRCRCCPCRGGAELVDAALRAARLGRSTAEPVAARRRSSREWGDSRYVDLRLAGELRLADALTTSTCCCRCSTTPSTTGSAPTRSTSCCAPAAGWLAGHPERELITRRYLAHQRAPRRGRRWPGWPRSTTPRRRRSTTPSTATTRPRPSDGAAERRGAARREQRRGGGPRRAARRPARDPGRSTSAAARAAARRRCSRDPPFTEIVGVDVSARALEHRRPPAAAGPDAASGSAARLRAAAVAR